MRQLSATLGEAGPIDPEASHAAERLSRLRKEIGRLQANEVRCQRIPQARDHLSDVVSDTEAAAVRIMECAETLMDADCGDPDSYRETVNAQAIAILEACAFQDLAGQRLVGVADTLDRIGHRIGRFADAVHPANGKRGVSRAEARRDKRKRELMLNGPGSGVSQADIDSLFDDAAISPRQA
ncbi:MAG: chemotaxis protein [Hyphomicrobiales bacterium]